MSSFTLYKKRFSGHIHCKLELWEIILIFEICYFEQFIQLVLIMQILKHCHHSKINYMSKNQRYLSLKSNYEYIYIYISIIVIMTCDNLNTYITKKLSLHT